MKKYIFTYFIIVILLSGCGQSETAIQATAQAEIDQTQAAIPTELPTNPATSTLTPSPEPSNTPQIMPTLTVFDAGFESGYTVEGTVKFEDSTDNAGISVMLLVYDPATGGASADSAIGPSITDNGGNYRFINLDPSNKYSLRAEGQRDNFYDHVSEWIDASLSSTKTIVVSDMILPVYRKVSFNWVYQPAETTNLTQDTISGNRVIVTEPFHESIDPICFDPEINTDCWRNFYFYVIPDQQKTCLFANNNLEGGIYDAGEIPIDDVTSAQEDAAFEKQCTLVVIGHTYVIKLNDGKHYAKLYITGIEKIAP